MTPQEQVRQKHRTRRLPELAELIYQFDKGSPNAKLDDLRSDSAKGVYICAALTLFEPTIANARMRQVHMEDAHAFAPIEDENRLVGRAIGVPPADWHPELLARLFARLRDAGATTREVPEFDRRALEHLVTAHQMAVVTAIDEDDRAALDPRIVVTELPGISADHLLCRVEGRELGRASDHYWTLAQTRSHELEPVPA